MGIALQVPKASQIVARDLKGRIARREITAGQCLPPEPELMAQYDVSRPTLREAIRILETEGLLTTTRGGRKGARVHYPTSEQAAEYAALVLQLRGASLLDIMQLASVLTPSAVRFAAERTPRPDLAQAFVYYEQIRDRDPRRSTFMLHKLKAELCALSGNEAIKLFAGMMDSIIELQLSEIPENYEELPRESLAAWDATYHRIGEALRAIGSGAGSKAERLMRQSLEEVIVYYRRLGTREALRFIPDWTRAAR
jgi:DNA-binding FadR family transcriptional regulator